MSKRVGGNILWNIAGNILPLLAGLIATPVLFHALGDARTGIFSLALGLIGFAGIFDLGLGRALTQSVASALGKNSSDAQIAPMVRAVLLGLLFLGVLWAILLWMSAPMLIERLSSFEEPLQAETLLGLYWIASALPFTLLSSGLVGLLEGLQKFKVVNTVRVPLGLLQFAVPAFVSLISPNVSFVIASLSILRFVTFFLWLFVTHSVFNLTENKEQILINPLGILKFGGWLTVSNLIGPLMVYADRFYLATLFPPAKVALYSIPFDAVFRATIFPVSIMNAVFPEMSHAKSSGRSMQALLQVVGKAMLLTWLPPLLIVMIFANDILSIWLSPSFANEADVVLQWLLLGVFINGFAHIPYAILHASGRTDITAKLHLAELPFYFLILFFLVKDYGIEGAAIAWSARVMFDMTLLFYAASRFEPHYSHVLRVIVITSFSGLAIMVFGMFVSNVMLKYLISTVVFIAYVIGVWGFCKNWMQKIIGNAND